MDQELLLMLLAGLVNNLIIGFLAILIAVVVGFGLAMMRVSQDKGFNLIAFVLIKFFIGLPPSFMIVIIYFGVWQLLDIKFVSSLILIGVIIGIAMAGYMADILYVSIRSWQTGLYKTRAFSLGFKQGFPLLVNQAIMILHLTMLCSVVGIKDVFVSATLYSSYTFQSVEAFGLAILIWLILIFILQSCAGIFSRNFAKEIRTLRENNG